MLVVASIGYISLHLTSSTLTLNNTTKVNNSNTSTITNQAGQTNPGGGGTQEKICSVCKGVGWNDCPPRDQSVVTCEYCLGSGYDTDDVVIFGLCSHCGGTDTLLVQPVVVLEYSPVRIVEKTVKSD